VLSPTKLPKLCTEQQAHEKTESEACQESVKMIEARARSTREMYGVTESQNSEYTPQHSDDGEKNEHAANPAGSRVMLQSHEHEKQG